MADHFQAGSCSTSGMIWWTTAPAAPAPDTLEPRSRLSCGESPVSLSSTSLVTFQDYIHDSGLLLDSAHPHPVDLGLSTSTAVEWPHAVLSGIESGQINMEMEIMNRNSFLQEPLLSAAAASTFGLPLHSQILEDARPERSSFDVSQMNSLLNSSSTAQSPLKQQQQLQFSNETPFWNPTVENSSLHHVRPPQPFPNQNPSYNNPILKTTQGVGSSCAAMEIKRNDSIEQVLVKKPRIETPSSLPTFKVRKEKLGDRITALQQLVSPFGKTDTASVLHEAIEYIKFLHDQVRVLSAPYLKGSHQSQQMKALDKSISKDSDQAQSEDLRSRGLCLVPISSTFAVANETDFWTPSFIGGTFR